MTRIDNKSIFDTLTARVTVSPTQLSELIHFIAMQRDIRLNAEQVSDLTRLRPLIATPISNIFTRAIELNKDSIFSFVKVPRSITSIPEVITYSHLTYDLEQLKPVAKNLYDVIHGLPGFSGSILYNVTSQVNSNGDLNDIISFQSNCVRDMLSRSYYSNKAQMWLTPSIIRFLCRCYNMSMSIAISGVYNLTFYEQQSLAVVFALYFLQQVTNSADAEAMVRTNGKMGLPQGQGINDVLNKMRDTLGNKMDDMTLDDVCTVINNLGVNRLTSVNRKLLYTRTRSLGPDIFTSMMAVEYPPYWVYLMLLALSGRKIGLHNITKSNVSSEELKSFPDSLLTTQSFLPAL